MPNSRNFSTTMQVANSDSMSSHRLPAKNKVQEVNVGFILLEHFSMMAFTAAVDVLVTANLVQSYTTFNVSTYGLKTINVTSDLNINIATTATLDALHFNSESTLDILIVCGGLRADLTTHPKLNQLLAKANKRRCILGGIWNGAISLAQANLLTDIPCALHINNHPLMHEHFPQVNLTEKSYINHPQFISCADALSSLEMTLILAKKFTDETTYKAVKEILACNRSTENGIEKLTQHGDNKQLPSLLRNAIQLMNNNIEEPISIDEMTALININRRQLERLFKQHLNTSPSKHYLEIRLTYARRLLIQSQDSITSIGIACGFTNNNHFSHCFRLYFKASPSGYRKKVKTQQNEDADRIPH